MKKQESKQKSGKGKEKVKSPSRVQLFATAWTVAYQAPQSMEFSKQEYWSVFPFPTPGHLPNPGIKPGFSLTAGRHFTIWATREAPNRELDSKPIQYCKVISLQLK